MIFITVIHRNETTGLLKTPNWLRTLKPTYAETQSPEKIQLCPYLQNPSLYMYVPHFTQVTTSCCDFPLHSLRAWTDVHLKHLKSQSTSNLNASVLCKCSPHIQNISKWPGRHTMTLFSSQRAGEQESFQDTCPAEIPEDSWVCRRAPINCLSHFFAKYCAMLECTDISGSA